MKAFLEAGANANAELNAGESLLRYAARQSDPEIVRLLLEPGADLRTRSGRPYLAEAAGNCRADAVRMLVHRGVSVDERDSNGRTALMSAAADRHGQDGAQQIAALTALLEAHGDVNLADTHGRTALMAAAGCNSVESVMLLLQHGADIDAWDSEGANALMAAACDLPKKPLERVRQVETAKALLAAGIDENASAKDGTTALMIAADAGNLDLIRLLLSRGARSDSRDAHGRTARMRASALGHPDAADLLRRSENRR